MAFQDETQITGLADRFLESQCLPDSATNVLHPEVSQCLLCLQVVIGR